MSETGASDAGRLDQARSLAARRDWRALADWGASVGEGVLLEEPEAAYLYADALHRVGDLAGALRLIPQVERRVRQGGDRHLLPRVVNLAGAALFAAGKPAEAGERFEELLEEATSDANDDFVGRACNNLGAVETLRGRRDTALTYFVRALASYRRIGWTRGLAQTHHNLGIAYRDLGFDADADGNFRRAIELATLAESEDVIAMSETERAMLRARAGDGQLAAELARRAIERCRRIDDPIGVAHAVRVLAAAARADGRDADADARLGEALAMARALDDALLLAEVLRDQGLLFRDLGREPEARAALAESASHFEQLGAAAEAEALRAILAALPEGAGG
ncbi:MAG TPA: tetratricopeptide repeat protein [Longimicrobium sp.]|nr:tetratricopeptide repeat protein [Longimicrobium sp.]